MNTFKSDKMYTNKIVNYIMSNLEWGGEYFSEYYKIDHTWWEVNEEKKEQEVNIYNWKLLLAVEHENNWHDWTYEMAKLDYIICPLRVVIGFRDNMGNDLEEETNIIRIQSEKLTNKRLIDSDHEFGIILMDRKYQENQEKENPLGMRCYRLQADGGVESL